MSNENDAVRTHQLTKHFRGGGTRRPAVHDLNLHVPTGSVYGFLGPNGSGKSTTIRMLLGLLRPDTGSVTLLGEEIPACITEVLPHVGALIEGPAFHPYLTGWSNLARLDAADRNTLRKTSRVRIGDALERVGLAYAAQKKYRTYSLGMKQRLGLAAALLRERQLLILDEPTNGLDPQGTREVRSLIAGLASTGTTVLLSTHLLAEVEQICTHAGIMHHGKLLTQGALSELSNQNDTRVELSTTEPERAAKLLRSEGVGDVQHRNTLLSGTLGDIAPPHLVETLVHAGVPVHEFNVRRQSLEEVFVQLTGEGFHAND